MQLYTIRFTTQKRISTYDKRGKVIGETQVDTPICLTALPYLTAMSYSACDNFALESYQMDQKRVSSITSKPAWAGAATKKTNRADYEEAPAKVAATPKVSAVESAAMTGNMAGAING